MVGEFEARGFDREPQMADELEVLIHPMAPRVGGVEVLLRDPGGELLAAVLPETDRAAGTAEAGEPRTLDQALGVEGNFVVAGLALPNRAPKPAQAALAGEEVHAVDRGVSFDDRSGGLVDGPSDLEPRVEILEGAREDGGVDHVTDGPEPDDENALKG